MSAGLAADLAGLAARDRIVVGLDFDGVLAPLVDDPEASAPVDGAVAAVQALAALPRTTVAMVSGRDLATLGRLSGVGPAVLLVGSHGAERSDRPGAALLDAAAADRYAALRDDLEAALSDHPQARLEVKPTALVLHTRGVPAAEAAAAHAALTALLRRHPQVHSTPGKDVLEMAVVEAGKGPALLALVEETEADGVLYVGDDVTDERAFAVLHDELGDRALTVRVGEGQTRARHRVPDEHAVVRLLRDLAGGRG